MADQNQEHDEKRYVVARYKYSWPMGRVREVVASKLSLQEAERIANELPEVESENVVIEDPQTPGIDSQVKDIS